eukprot:TRINITY_DN3610_c0_g1_i13.p1 TRINITY_DN3610_c0_g1~~TRINITY_DN3610_c0_g1_i13.p1  ORF type:complete len:137 (-),score=35.33 TRINITY_DN3610_c0_g1_i13:221-631(-)
MEREKGELNTKLNDKDTILQTLIDGLNAMQREQTKERKSREELEEKLKLDMEKMKSDMEKMSALLNEERKSREELEEKVLRLEKMSSEFQRKLDEQRREVNERLGVVAKEVIHSIFSHMFRTASEGDGGEGSSVQK